MAARSIFVMEIKPVAGRPYRLKQDHYFSRCGQAALVLP